MRWLIDHHHANVYQEVSKLPARELQAVHVVVACHECRGSGKVGGGRCHQCLGNGTSRVVTQK